MSTTQVLPAQSTPAPYTIALPQTAKQVVKASAITCNKATLALVQNGQLLFVRSTEGMNLSESYAMLSNIFHYQFKGKVVRLDKFNPLEMILTFGEATYSVRRVPKMDKAGKYIAPTSQTIGALLKDLYHNFAADLMTVWTEKGNYLLFTHAANAIASFTNTPVRPAVPTAKVAPVNGVAKKVKK